MYGVRGGSFTLMANLGYWYGVRGRTFTVMANLGYWVWYQSWDIYFDGKPGVLEMVSEGGHLL